MGEKNSNTNKNDIAIIGMSARFPNSETYNAYWENIREGKSCISDIPQERWNWKNYYKIEGKIKNRTVNHWGGFIDDMSTFDYRFFLISKREADNMDPQQRLLLEESWSCLEDAGVCPSELSGRKVGVFVAGCNMDFRDLLERNREISVPHHLTGSSGFVMANRISYTYNLKGPSVQIDTACSGALAAIHYGIESIMRGECEMAIAGACNVMIAPDNYVRLAKMLMLSQTGKVRTFDKDADGYIRGEGVGMVLLKPLQKAIEDGDRIHGVIKGVAINHCGHTQSLTYPSDVGQAEVIQEAIRKSGVSVKDIQYIELHGTGTPKGDPIEFNGIKKAFQTIAAEQDVREEELKCALGSVKTNVGHLENAAGMASLIKVVLAMQHREIPQTLNFENLNPLIKIENTPFHLATKREIWKTKQNKPRHAGVSSFGLGGTNVHLILEEYQSEKREEAEENNWFLFALSAKTKEALQNRISDLQNYINKNKTSIILGDLSYTLMCGREHLEHRIVLVANSLEDVCDKLKTPDTWVQKKIEEQEFGDILEKVSYYKKDKRELEYKELLEKLASAYISGIDISWKKIYGAKWKKLHLPTYSFAATECWIPERGPVEGVLPYEEEKTEKIEQHGESELLCYHEVWKEKNRLEARINLSGAIIVLLPWEYRNFYCRNEQAGITYLYIEEASCYQTVSDHRIRINTENEQDYGRAFKEFLENYKNIIGIFDFFALGSNLKNSLYYPVNILRALSQNKMHNVEVISALSFANVQERAIAESRIGYERSISVVIRGVKMRFVLEKQGKRNIDEWFAAIWKEFITGETGSVLYENGVRKKLSIQELTLSSEKETPLKEGGVYIITGGAGGLGKMFAKHLLKKYHAKLILTGRSSIEKKKKIIDELKGFGGNVQYICADVTSRADMTNVVKQANEAYGRINGVIYAAGIENEESILTKQRENFETILSAKIDGAIILDEVLEEESLDFICYFASSSAILGDFGSCDYSIGNRYLQEYANYTNKLGKTPKYAINWPMWENGGLSMNDKDAERLYLKASGQNYLQDEEGLQIFEKILSSGYEHVLVMTGKKEKIEQIFDTIENGKEIERKTEPAIEAEIYKQEEKTVIDIVEEDDEIPLERKLLMDLMEISSSILCIGKECFTDDTNFADIGYDSVNLGDFAETLSLQYQIEVTPDVFFGYPTFKKLSNFLSTKYENKLSEFYNSKEVETLKENIEQQPVQEKQDTEENKQENSFEEKEDAIAIVGMSGVFPSAENVQELWDILYNQKEVIAEIPESRIPFDDNEKKNRIGRPWRMGMVMKPAQFDPLFFDISPSEAEEMDPRQRLLLEETWKALEDAGMNEKDFDNGLIGMFVGAEDGDYRMMVGPDVRFTSNHNGVMASRLAYLLNFNGPCLSVNTACSSSLTAFHQAYLSIKNGDCDVAVAAGASLVLRKENYMDLANAGMLSNDNRCYAFDQRATGMVPADAVAVVVLKKLSLAKRDHNYIYGVIAGSGINYDGKTNGITAPSGSAQEKLYRSVYDKNGVNPKDISYIVTHGTGTKLGDPIEINALQDAFHTYQIEPKSCAITSVKSNIGHALAASGIVSIISLLLAMKEEVIPASINSEQESKYIHWANSPLYVNRTNKVWKDEDGKRRIGAVSSFGMSGTNGHILIKSYPNRVRSKKEQFCYLMVIAAKTKEALERKKLDMKQYLLEKEDADMASISYTLLEGRSHFKYRFAAVVKDKNEFIECLEPNCEEAITGEVDREFYERKRELNEIQFILEHIEEDLSTVQYKERLTSLAEYYCKGYTIDGNKLLCSSEPVRIQLPSYAFEHRDYWYKEKAEDMVLVPKWESMDVSYDNIDKKTIVICENSYIADKYTNLFHNVQAVVCSCEESLLQILEKLKNVDNYGRVVWVQADLDEIRKSSSLSKIDNQAGNILYVFKVVKALIEAYGTAKELEFIAVTKMGQIVNKQSQISPDSAGVSGFLGVLAKEIPNWNIHVLDVENLDVIEDHRMMHLVMDNGTVAALRNGTWYQKIMVNEKARLETIQNVDVYRKNGIYVVIGGAGDVGSLWTEHIVRNYHAQVIWIGRRKLNQEIEEKIDQIGAYGPKPVYYTADVTDVSSLERAKKNILQEYGNIHGVIVATVADFDRGIQMMSEEEFKKIVEVKAMGCINTEMVFGNKTIDFILNFSSSSAIEMPLGQAGYTAGCCFADAYAHLISNKKDHISKTINWGFWGALGAGKKMPESIKSRIYMTGARPLEPFCAFYALDKILRSDWVQAEYMNRVLDYNEAVVEDKETVQVVQQNSTETKEDICKRFVVKTMCSILKISESILDVRERFEKYGIDSITILQLINGFRKTLPNIESTVFYECQTTQDLINYILQNHQEELKGLEETKAPVSTEKESTVEKETIEKNRVQEDDIAIIGMSGRFPNADNLEEYWDNLMSGRDCISEIPESRWSLDGFYEPNMEKAVKEKKSYCKYGGFINGFSEFDPRFFKISPREAMTMDPQERILLEESYKALENAAYPPNRMKEEGKLDVGVFVGVTRTGFELHNQRLWDNGEDRKLSTCFGEMANRISYTFDLKGPSFAVDTMCSSSLTALHEACEHIRRGSCGMAIVGTANIYTHPATYRSFCEMRMLSPSGRCHAFGKNADGFVPGEGVAAIVLKPLSKAYADNDQVLGVIKATSINHDGRTNGFTVPNPVAQANMIRNSLDRFGINARQISYVEAHGTGTKLGDPIEISGLTKAYRKDTNEKQYCAIGSVKSNIGHCEAAAGIAGVIKVLLQMQNKMLVPSLHSEEINPLIDFKNSPFYVQQELQEWKRPILMKNGNKIEYPRMAAVSAFGAGGANAHVIIEEDTRNE